MRTTIGFALVALINVGCTSEMTGQEELNSTEIVNGTPTWDRPEIGSYHLWGSDVCTATLIAPQIAITAGHCVKNCDAQDKAGAYGSFIVHASATHRLQYTVDRVWALDHCGDPIDELIDEALNLSVDVGDDIALLHLADPVEAHVATPATLSTRDPENQRVRGWGFGCNQRAGFLTGEKGEGWKRFAEWIWGKEKGDNVCSADEGGPVAFADDGMLTAIHLRHVGWPVNRSFRAHIWKHYEEIMGQVAAWGCLRAEDHCSNGVFDCSEENTDCGGDCGACAAPKFALEPQHTRMCATVKEPMSELEPLVTDNGAPVVQAACAGLESQSWELHAMLDGYFRLKSSRSQRCLEIRDWSTTPDATAGQWDCHDGANQRWELRYNQEGYYQIVNKHSGLCLDVAPAAYVDGAYVHEGARVIQTACGGSFSQRWTARPL